MIFLPGKWGPKHGNVDTGDPAASRSSPSSSSSSAVSSPVSRPHDHRHPQSRAEEELKFEAPVFVDVPLLGLHASADCLKRLLASSAEARAVRNANFSGDRTAQFRDIRGGDRGFNANGPPLRRRGSSLDMMRRSVSMARVASESSMDPAWTPTANPRGRSRIGSLFRVDSAHFRPDDRPLVPTHSCRCFLLVT